MLADSIVLEALDVGDCKFTEDPDTYMAAVYPNDDPDGPMRGNARGYPDAKDKDGNPDPKPPQSSCGLRAAACCVKARVDWPPLYESYLHRNDIMTVLDQMAKKSGAACAPSKNSNDPFHGLKAGSLLYIGKGMTAHFIVVTSCLAAVFEEDGSAEIQLRTHEGGGGAGNVLANKDRTLDYNPRNGVVTVVGDRFNRTVNYWVDPDQLPALP